MREASEINNVRFQELFGQAPLEDVLDGLNFSRYLHAVRPKPASNYVMIAVELLKLDLIDGQISLFESLDKAKVVMDYYLDNSNNCNAVTERFNRGVLVHGKN
jgi:hypothetical protein